ncbi:MAG: hypothetical protein ACQEST_10490 [Bacteroidota bacterium]
MEADYLHLIVNHIPIFSIGFGLLILGWGLLKKSSSILQIALVFFLIGAVSSYIAMETGEAAEDIAEELNVASHDVIHDHEEAAEIAFWFTILTGVISVVGFFALSYNIRWQNTLFGILAISALISLGTLLYTAYQGGKIFHHKNQTSNVIDIEHLKSQTQPKTQIYIT